MLIIRCINRRPLVEAAITALINGVCLEQAMRVIQFVIYSFQKNAPTSNAG